ncbi:MAG TPA: hypothetical protein VFR67_06295 [Pilimelia sp.]|nr:hypothetical protein [Pilimelia sp.]
MTAIATSARTDRTRLLRTALRLDALATGAAGLAYVAGAGVLDSVLDVPPAALVSVGVFFVAWSAALLALARQDRPNRKAVWAVIALNAVWAVDSLVSVAAGWLDPTDLGTALVVAQALLVAGFAAAQYAGLRRAG